MKYLTINDVKNFFRKCNDDTWLKFYYMDVLRLGVVKYVTVDEDNDMFKFGFRLVKVELRKDGKFRGYRDINKEFLEGFKSILATKNVYSMRLCYDYEFYENSENITWDKVIN